MARGQVSSSIPTEEHCELYMYIAISGDMRSELKLESQLEVLH